jgi:hypothetical protein
VNDEVGLVPACDRLGELLGFFSGGEVPDILPNLAAHDPVFESVVRNHVNSGRCHRLSSAPRAMIVGGLATAR